MDSIKNNVFVNKGDTLLKISKENLESDKRTQDVLSDSVSLLLSDINNLLQDQTIHLQTSTAREDFFKFQSGKMNFKAKSRRLK